MVIERTANAGIYILLKNDGRTQDKRKGTFRVVFGHLTTYSAMVSLPRTTSAKFPAERHASNHQAWYQIKRKGNKGGEEKT